MNTRKTVQICQIISCAIQIEEPIREQVRQTEILLVPTKKSKKDFSKLNFQHLLNFLKVVKFKEETISLRTTSNFEKESY